MEVENRVNPMVRLGLGLVSFAMVMFPQRVDAQRIAQASAECQSLLDEDGELIHHLVARFRVTRIPVREGYTIWMYLKDHEQDLEVLLGANEDGEDVYEKEIVDAHKKLTLREDADYTFSVMYPGYIEDELIDAVSFRTPISCS